jgi:plasmid replication initiation protein
MKVLKDQAENIKSQFKDLCKESKLEYSYFWYRRQKQYKHEGGRNFFNCELRSHTMDVDREDIEQITKSLVEQLDIPKDWTVTEVLNYNGDWLGMRIKSKFF